MDGLSKHRFRIGSERGFQLLVAAVRGHEGEFDAHALHGHGEQVEGPAVDGAGTDHVIPAAGDIEHGIERSRLARRRQHGCGAAFQIRDLGRHKVVRGILQAGIEISRGLQIEKGAHGFAGSVFERGALVDGHLTGIAVAGLVAGLHAPGPDTFFRHMIFLLTGFALFRSSRTRDFVKKYIRVLLV